MDLKTITRNDLLNELQSACDDYLAVTGTLNVFFLIGTARYIKVKARLNDVLKELNRRKAKH